MVNGMKYKHMDPEAGEITERRVFFCARKPKFPFWMMKEKPFASGAGAIRMKIRIVVRPLPAGRG